MYKKKKSHTYKKMDDLINIYSWEYKQQQKKWRIVCGLYNNFLTR